MIDSFDFWNEPSMESEVAPGNLSRRLRGERKHDMHIGMLSIGRNVCFGGKGGGGSAPAADPSIGIAALKSAETGEEWLKFAGEQFKAGNIRQADMDALTTKVINSQMSSQDQANAWAAEDRQIQGDYRDKYDGWAEEDRDLGRQTKGELDQYATDAIATGNKYGDNFDGQAAKQLQFADEQQQRYKDTFQPVEDRVASDAMGWDSDARMAEQAAKARGDVLGNAAAAEQQQQRQMSSMGVDPRSGRFAGQARSNGLNTALASAGAQNIARNQVRDQGLALRGQAVGIGQNVQQTSAQASGLGLQATSAGHTARTTGQSLAMQAKNMGLAAAGVGNTAAQLGIGNQGAGYQGLSLGVNAGSAAMGAQGAANQSFNQNGNVMSQGFGGSMQGYGQQGSMLNSVYGNQVQAWSAQQQANSASSAGIGSMLGTGIGAYAAL